MRDDLILRRELPTDAQSVLDLIDAAFPTAPAGEGGELSAAAAAAGRSVEALLVEQLRADQAVIPELTFVAEVDGQVVGQVTCSRGTLGDASSVGLGPISVRPDQQQQGIGAALMSAVIASAEQAGEPVIVLLGDPGYYGHFGFRPGAAHGIHSPEPAWGEHFMAMVLRAWRPELSGDFRYAAAFDRL